MPVSPATRPAARNHAVARTVFLAAALALLCSGCYRTHGQWKWIWQKAEPAGEEIVNLPPPEAMPESQNWENLEQSFPVLPELGAGADPGERSFYPPARREEADQTIPELRTVYFDFDSSDLREDTKAALDENAQWLRQNPNAVILIEGHCDENGTREYNFQLGQERAESARAYLVQQGVDPNRLRVISFGEDRPVALGHTEEAWKLNRRARFPAFE